MNLSRRFLGSDTVEEERYDLDNGLMYKYMFSEDDRLQWEADVIKAFGMVSISLQPSKYFYRSLDQNARDMDAVLRNMAGQNGVKAVEVRMVGGTRREFLDAMRKYDVKGGSVSYQIEYGSPLRVVVV